MDFDLNWLQDWINFFSIFWWFCIKIFKIAMYFYEIKVDGTCVETMDGNFIQHNVSFILSVRINVSKPESSDARGSANVYDSKLRKFN